MHPLRSALLTGVALLLLCAALVLFASRPPAPLPATAAPTVFSAERALRHVQMIAQRPHPNGSAELVRVREYLVAQLTTKHIQSSGDNGAGTMRPADGNGRLGAPLGLESEAVLHGQAPMIGRGSVAIFA